MHNPEKKWQDQQRRKREKWGHGAKKNGRMEQGWTLTSQTDLGLLQR
jgi:hypothetical protein